MKNTQPAKRFRALGRLFLSCRTASTSVSRNVADVTRIESKIASKAVYDKSRCIYEIRGGSMKNKSCYANVILSSEIKSVQIRRTYGTNNRISEKINS